MKTLNLLSLTISAGSIFCCASTFAQGWAWAECKAIEFAEMQSMSQAELEQAYCKNKKFSDANSKMHSSSLETANAMTKNGSFKKADDYIKEASIISRNGLACREENTRIYRVIKKLNPQAETPKCE